MFDLLKKMASKNAGKLGASALEGRLLSSRGHIYSYTKSLNVSCHCENSSNKRSRRDHACLLTLTPARVISTAVPLIARAVAAIP
jgi:hypothetical protein